MADLPSTMKAVVNKRQGDKVVYGVAEVPMPAISCDKCLIIKVLAAPINPSDLGSVGMAARLGDGTVTAGDLPGTVTAPLPEKAAGMFKADGAILPTGSEGTGVVVAAGASAEAQAFIGKKVSFMIGATYAQYVKCTYDNPSMVTLPDDTPADKGAASMFVNPMTVVGFLHTMREEGHTAIVHTAATSQLGRMLVKHCKEEGVQLVNIVRKEEGVATLKALGAEFVVNSSAPTFKADLLAAITATGATIAFDATGGGTLAQTILTSFNEMLKTKYPEEIVGWYGPSRKNSVYKYGALDKTESVFAATGVGNWTWGGWLMPFHYKKYPPAHFAKGCATAVAGLKDTFSSAYGTRLSLEDLAASPEKYLATLQSQTDLKFLVVPNGV